MYHNPLASQMSTPSNIELNMELHQRACLGDETARQELITGNMPLVFSKVESFIRSNPKLEHLRDDLISAGFLGLCMAVNKLCENDGIEKPSGYLATAIGNAFGELVEDEVLIYYSRRTQGRAKNDGRTLPQHTTLSESSVAGALVEPSETLDVLDLVLSCCQNRRECKLIRLRYSGLSTAECADRLNLSRATIYRTLGDIEKRYEAKAKELQ